MNNTETVFKSPYIDKADAYIDIEFKPFGSSKKLREIGNKQVLQLSKTYCDAYEQALKDNGLL